MPPTHIVHHATQVARVGKYPTTMWERIREGVVVDPKKKTLNLCKSFSLHSVKKVQFAFDPFASSNVSCREFLCLIHDAKFRQTNLSCKIRMDLKNDRKEPLIDVDLTDGRELKIFSENLTLNEILTTWIKYAPPFVPPTAAGGGKK